jgi:DNA-binding transcriptional MocR family regulator
MASLTAAALARLLGTWNLGASPAYRELSDVVRLLVLDGRVALDTALPERARPRRCPGGQPDHGHRGLRPAPRPGIPQQRTGQQEPDQDSTHDGGRHRSTWPRRCLVVPAGAVRDLRRQAWSQDSPHPDSPAPGLAAPAGLIDLAYSSLPASGELVHRAFAAALTELPALLPGFGYDAIGLLPLREAVAARYTAAGVPTTADQVLVTSGAQHALNIVLRALTSRQDRVLVEHPSYPNALDAIRAAGCRAVPVAFSAPPAGKSDDCPTVVWDMQGLQAALAQQRPRLAYLVPDFHNPTGQLMPDPERRRLVQCGCGGRDHPGGG